MLLLTRLVTMDTYRSVCVGNHPSKQIEQGAHYIILRGDWTIFNFIIFFASLCSFICLQAVYQLSGPEY